MRSVQYSTCCARPPTLPSTSVGSWNALIAVGFAAGLALFVAGSVMLRSYNRQSTEKERGAKITWPQLVDENLRRADKSLRLDMIDRLSYVPGEWSRSVLERALEEETDETIREAIERAL